MKKFLYLTLLSCSSIFALPEWQFTIGALVKGRNYYEPIQYECDEKNCTVVASFEPHFAAEVTCSESEQSNEIIYTVEMFDTELLVPVAKGTVVANVGQDATITLYASQGEFTITFSSKI